MMRAFVWASFVMMPLCEPVKLTAGTPRPLSARESSAIEMRSPAESSMSSSRRAGSSERLLASSSNSSVVWPMAETTATIDVPDSWALAMRAATCRMLSTSAIEEPPNFCTTMPTRLAGGDARADQRRQATVTSGQRYTS